MAEIVSIIIPAYNCGGLLPRCVQSLLRQTYSDLEIILVDDGSTDDTPEVCDSLASGDARIKVIHRANGGVSSARNAGIQAATGAYITFADADDYVDPDHIARLHSMLQRMECDVAACGYKSENENSCTEPASSRGGRKEVCYSHDSAVCELLAGGAVGGYVWNKLYRRALLEGMTFRSDVKILEDLLFNFEVFSRVQKMAFCPEGSYHYIQRGQSAMHRQFGEEHRVMVDTARQIRDALADQSPELADAGNGLLATTILWVCDVMAEYGPYDKSLFRQYSGEFRPLRWKYLRNSRVPLSYRASAVFFSMGFGIFRLAVRAVRNFM